MGKKGDRPAKEGLAKDLYEQGMTLGEISKRLDVSVTSLSRWKKETKQPDNDLDDWDLARQGHRDFIEQLRDLFKEQLKHIRGMPPGSRSPADYDSLSKAAAIVRRWDDIEKAEAAKQMSEATPVDLDKPALFLGFLEWLALKLRETDPEGLKILARNYDSLVIQFKAEHAQTT